MQYLWIALLVLSALIEGLWTRGIFVCFVPASLTAMILAFFKLSLQIQLGIFFAVAGLSFFFLRPLLARLCRPAAPSLFSVEGAIGMHCTVVERLDNLAGRGAVNVMGMEWAARTISDEIVIEAGSTVEIIAVEGVKFICRATK